MPENKLPIAAASERDFQLYQSIRDYERHLNGLIFEVRKISSIWMLLIFSAIAAVTYDGAGPAPAGFDPPPLLALIALFGNFGILTLWIQDQQVYRRLFSAAFKMGLEIERRQPEFPPVRWQMWKNSGFRGMGHLQALIYAVPMVIVAICGAFTAVAEALRAEAFWPFALVAFAGLGSAVPPLIVFALISNTDDLEMPSRDRADTEKVIKAWEDRAPGRSSLSPQRHHSPSSSSRARRP